MTFPTKFAMTRDINGYNGFGVQFSNINYKTILSATVEQHFTVPSTASKWLAVFSFEPGSSVWVDNNNTAALPGGSFAATTSQLNPAGREVNSADVLSFITNDTTAEIGVSFYALG